MIYGVCKFGHIVVGHWRQIPYVPRIVAIIANSRTLVPQVGTFRPPTYHSRHPTMRLTHSGRLHCLRVDRLSVASANRTKHFHLVSYDSKTNCTKQGGKWRASESASRDA